MPEPPRRRAPPRRPFRPSAGAVDRDQLVDALDGPLAFLGDPDAFLPRFVLSLALQPPRGLRRRPR